MSLNHNGYYRIVICPTVFPIDFPQEVREHFFRLELRFYTVLFFALWYTFMEHITFIRFSAAQLLFNKFSGHRTSKEILSNAYSRLNKSVLIKYCNQFIFKIFINFLIRTHSVWRKYSRHGL